MLASSLFNQLLDHFPAAAIALLVKKHQDDRNAKGFASRTRWREPWLQRFRVNAIAPGFVRTRFANWPSSAFDEGEAQAPLGRLAAAEDVAKTVLFLVADAVATTGETIVVDGGTTELGPRSRKHV